MKKMIIIMAAMTFILIAGQQFIIKKPCQEKQITSKKLFYDLVDLEKKVPSLLHHIAELLHELHVNITAYVEGDKSVPFVKQPKNGDFKTDCNKNIMMLNDAIDDMQKAIKKLIELLHENESVFSAKEC